MGGLLSYLLAALSVSGPDAFFADNANSPGPKPLVIRSTKPVTVTEAKFVLVAETEWRAGEPDEPVAIDMQFQITNLANGAVAFSMSDTFGIRIVNSDGKEVKARRKKKGAELDGPVLIAPGASFALWRVAELSLDENTKVCELCYYDGAGGEIVFGPLEPGNYKLVYWYKVSPEERAKHKVEGATTWSGEATTHEVPIRIFAGTTRGMPAETGEYGSLNKVRRMRESKPVTMNDATFVLAAETNLKAGRNEVPIELQLRITNVSKNELLFGGVCNPVIVDRDGKRVPFGKGTGRNVSRRTRSVLIPSGASYSICRQAILRWNAETKLTDLTYWDGTGNVMVYPLSPGFYKVSFPYSVSPEQIERQPGDPEIWFGRAKTEAVEIEVQPAG